MMTGKITMHLVAGQTFKVWADFDKRGCFAEDERGNVKQISAGGYIRNDLTVRKAIANKFRLETFRK